MSDPVEVTSIWGKLTAGGSIGALFVLAGIFARQMTPWRQATLNDQARFQSGLLKRVQRLEREAAWKDAKHEAERGLDRHKFTNVTQALDMFLELIELAPERAVETAKRIREMRSRQALQEATEKAAIAAAETEFRKREKEIEENEDA